MRWAVCFLIYLTVSEPPVAHSSGKYMGRYTVVNCIFKKHCPEIVSICINIQYNVDKYHTVGDCVSLRGSHSLCACLTVYKVYSYAYVSEC